MVVFYFLSFFALLIALFLFLYSVDREQSLQGLICTGSAMYPFTKCKNRRWASPFSLANGGLANLLQLWFLGREINQELDGKICLSCSGWVFFVFRCLRLGGQRPGLRLSLWCWNQYDNNNNNINSFFVSHYSNNIVDSSIRASSGILNCFPRLNPVGRAWLFQPFFFHISP